MILIKCFNLISILIICFYIGIIKARKYEIRVAELNKFQNALLMFKTKIEFTHEPIKNVFEEISKIIYLEERNIFIETIKNNYNNQINESWIDAAKCLENCLSIEDIDIIKTFGKLLGKTDIEGQVSEILLTKNLIEKQIEKAENEKQKNSKLCKSMGIISGLGICIIFI